MASNRNHLRLVSDVTPWGQPRDYPIRFSTTHRPVDLYTSLERQIARRDAAERAEEAYDLRLIGIGLACGYAFVCIARVAALGWL